MRYLATRRMVLFGALAAVSQTGCSPTSTPPPSEVGSGSPSGLAYGAPKPGYALLFTNMGAGESIDGKTGLLLLLDSDGGSFGSHRFTPEEGAQVTATTTGAVWLAHDRVWRWGASLESWEVVPFPYGATDHTVSVDGSTLISVNGYEASGGYRWGFVVVDELGARSWEVPRVLTRGVSWVGEHAYGFASIHASDSVSTLTELGPDSDLVTVGPAVVNDDLWGHAEWKGTVVALVLNDSQVPELLQISPASHTVTRIPVHGPAALSAHSWRTGSNGPHGFCRLGDQLLWIAGPALWEADPLTGESREIVRLDPELRWQLKEQGLFGLGFSDHVDGSRSWAVTHIDPATGDLLRHLDGIEVEGPRDLWLQSVAYLV